MVMASLLLIKLPAKILKQKLNPLEKADIESAKIKELIAQMRETMVASQGVGLAANQVNENLQIFVIDKKLADEHSVPDVLINPEITEPSKDVDEMEEGCLSIPEYFVNIKRAKKIKIKALDENGKKIKFKARGFLARVLQHETDHLNGMTIKDRSSQTILNTG